MINRLYWASKIYFTSYGIAWFNLDVFTKMLKYIGHRRKATIDELNRLLLSETGTRFTRTGKEGYYYAQLLRHLDLAAIIRKRKTYEVALTGYGQSITNKILKPGNPRETIDTIRKVFLKWPPLQVFLKYILTKGKTTPKEVIKDLGGEMKKWTKILYQLGIAKNIMRKPGVAKPYNKFVVQNLFVPLSQQLNLVLIQNGKLQINPEAKETIEKLVTAEKEYDIIKTMPGEYTIYSAIADTLSDAKEAIIASPWINGTIVELVKNTYKISKAPKEITIIVRKTKNNINYIKQLTKTPTQIKAYYYNKLHAKIATNPNGPAAISSANLVKTSLLRNYEIGIYYQKTPTTITTALQELISISAKITTW